MLRKLFALATVIVVSGCSKPPETIPEPPAFGRGSHVDQCLPALYALDTLAANAVGDQIGVRAPAAPWLRINRALLDQRDKTQLNAKSLGPVLMPMLYLAQEGLNAEIPQIDAEQLKAWQQEFAIDRGALEFMDYCTRETAFAQWRAPDYTIPWLQTLALPEQSSSWWQRFFSNEVDAVEIDQDAQWQYFAIKPFAPKKIQVVKDRNGRALVSESSEHALLERYAPLWSIQGDAENALANWSLDDSEVSFQNKPAVYSYLDYGEALSAALIRLNYVVWLPQSKAVQGMLVRMNITFDGKPIAYETVHLDGSNYHVFVSRDYTLSTLPEPLVAKEVRAVPKMSVMMQAKPLGIIDVRALSGVEESIHYELLDFNQLMQLSDGNTTASLFDESGIATVGQSSGGILAWFDSNAGKARKPSEITILPSQALYFDQPDLLAKFGLTKK